MATTTIEWTRGDDGTAGEVWNPTTGCDQVGSPNSGCDNCYALTMAKRLKAMGNPKYQTDGDPRTSGPGFGLAMHESALYLPLKWNRPRRIFTNSMSDLFHPKVTDEFLARVFAVPPWIWLGVSVEDQERADARLPRLEQTPTAVPWLSCEPLLGPLNLRPWLHRIGWCVVGGESGRGARPMDPAWVRSLVDQCAEVGVPLFFKQAGAVLAREWGCTDAKGHKPEDWPEPFPRQFPSAVAA